MSGPFLMVQKSGEVSDVTGICNMNNVYLEPETSIYKWLFQLDDSKSLHGKCLSNQTSIKKWLFGVPGRLKIVFGFVYGTLLHFADDAYVER